MPLPKKDKFLEEVLTYIKFPFDRDGIKSELESHILYKIDYYIEHGYDEVKAEELSINDMGEAKEIGIQLNKEHNPVIGWLWKITNVLVVLSAIFSVYFIGFPLIDSLVSGNSIEDIPASNIVYKIDVDKKVKLDDTIIHFIHVVYEKNGDMNIFFEYYDTKLWGTGWSLGDIGEVSDNLGNKYYAGSGGTDGGIISSSRKTLSNFSKEAETLIINYDHFNRKYRVEIPLGVGGNNQLTQKNCTKYYYSRYFVCCVCTAFRSLSKSTVGT